VKWGAVRAACQEAGPWGHGSSCRWPHSTVSCSWGAAGAASARTIAGAAGCAACHFGHMLQHAPATPALRRAGPAQGAAAAAANHTPFRMHSRK
jgi:hypothetical protein